MRKGLAGIGVMSLVLLGACSSGRQEASPAPTTVSCMTSNAAYAVATTLDAVDDFARSGGATAVPKRKDEDNRLKFKSVPNIIRTDWSTVVAGFKTYNETARPALDAGNAVDSGTVEALRNAVRRPFQKIVLFMTEFCPGPWTDYVRTLRQP